MNLRQIASSIIRPLGPGDLVLSNDRLPYVDRRGPGKSGMELALFLQFHDDENAPLGRGRVAVRFAYRNYRPQTVRFRRTLACRGATLAEYDTNEILEVLSARSKGRAYADLVAGGVLAERQSSGALITARVQQHRPRRSLFEDGENEFSVAFPGKELAECSCCLVRFPT